MDSDTLLGMCVIKKTGIVCSKRTSCFEFVLFSFNVNRTPLKTRTRSVYIRDCGDESGLRAGAFFSIQDAHEDRFG